MKMIDEQYAFPINPVWPVRDPGWYKVFDKLRNSPQCQPGQHTLEGWLPKRVMDRIDEVLFHFVGRTFLDVIEADIVPTR